jgi:hypothetical protein
LKSYLGSEEWNGVEACTRKYCKRKREMGRFLEDKPPGATWDTDKIATFNYWENREAVM